MCKKFLILALLLIMTSFNSVCFAKSDAKVDELTLGSIQRSVHPGMSQDAVASVLGFPNIATKDSIGNETWIYDKISTEVKESTGGGFFTLLLLGFGKNSDDTISTQKTLTVVIKFNEKSLVDTVSYHSSKF